MRRLSIILATLLLLTLTSCFGRAKEPEPRSPFAGRSGNFETTASIRYKELSATARVARENPQSCSVTFSAPESLADLSFVFWSDHVDLSYKALSFTFDPGSLPGGALANIAVDAINTAMRDNGLAVDYSGDVLTLSGTLDSGDFTLRIDGEEGNLLKLSVPEQDLSIEFLNFTFLE